MVALSFARRLFNVGYLAMVSGRISLRAAVLWLVAILALLVGDPSFVSKAHADDDGAGVVADAGYDRHASVGQTIQLDASQSLSPSGRPLVYSWAPVKLPAGSRAALSNSTALRPTFVVDVVGDYVFALTVRSSSDDGVGRATVVVSTNDVAPVADAGRNRKAAQSATIAFDGARSFDADGDPLFYSWTLVQTPYGSKAALSNKAAMRPQLTLDLAGTYVAELVVTDSVGKTSLPSRVAVSTKDALAGQPSAGPAQSVALGASARLDADGTYLPSGAPTNAAWSFLSAPAGSKAALATGADARQSFVADVAGDYVVETMISGALGCGDADDFNDGHYASQRKARLATALVTTGNVAPLANAGLEQSVAVGARVMLDGSQSSDVNGDALSYQWALLSRPAGSTAALDNAQSAQPRFTADVNGTYVAQLIVSDGFGPSKPATVVVVAGAGKPIADAGSDVAGKSGAAVLLDGSASNDPHGDALSAGWSILGLGDQLTGSLSTPPDGGLRATSSRRRRRRLFRRQRNDDDFRRRAPCRRRPAARLVDRSIDCR